MNIIDFESLKLIREKWLEISKNNGFNFHDILAGLYNDPSHFIFELIQNAEDVGATEVTFRLCEDNLEFFHNSKKDFDFDNIKAITGIGQSTKKDDINNIGKFGVGFKSVFAVTQTPYIYSGEYSVKIHDFVVPEEVENIKYNKPGTYIILPFNHISRSKEEIYDSIETALKSLDIKTLLFLRNIEMIHWEIGNEKGTYVKQPELVKEIEGCKFINILSEKEEARYLVFERKFSSSDKLNLGIAFKTEVKKDNDIFYESLVQEFNTKLIVYFPTEKDTLLNFYMHGPYRTTPNRENIPFDNPENLKILEETAALLADSIMKVKNLNLINIEFLELLPIESEYCEKNIIYKKCFDSVQAILRTNKVLPTFDGKFENADNLVLARGSDMVELLDSCDLKMLYNRNTWLDTNITEDKTKELRKYLLKQLEIKEVAFDDFSRSITEEFLSSKSDDWMIEFYKAANERPALLGVGYNGVLRSKPIIRTEENNHIQPYLNKEQYAFIPNENITSKRTLKKSLFNEEKVKECMDKLGLKAADSIDIIIETVTKKYPLQDKKVTREEYYNDFESIYKVFCKADSNGQSRIVNEMKNKQIMICEDINQSSVVLNYPYNIYFRDEDLIVLFKDIENKWFITSKLYDRYGCENQFRNFLDKIGVNQNPKRIPIDSTLSYDFKSNLRGGTQCSWQRVYDFTIDSLDEIINSITIKKSIALWNLMSRATNDFFLGTYEWSYHVAYKKYFYAYFINILNEKKWLLNQDKEWCSPKEILRKELSKEYNCDNSNILISYLKFKPDIVEQLPAEVRERLNAIMDLTDEKWSKVCELLNTINEAEETEEIAVEESPEQSITEIEDWEYMSREENEKEDTNASSESSCQEENGNNNINSNQQEDENNNKDNSDEIETRIVIRPTSNKNKVLGDWGEKKVISSIQQIYLKKGFNIEEIKKGFKAVADDKVIEVENMNFKGEVSVGYDIVIKENGAIKEYIEVKSKSGDGKELLSVSGTQWEFAKKLHLEGKGSMYNLYVVSNAGKPNSRIQKIPNPYKTWLEGKLYAHPVHLEL
ncbi:DUF3883 domain-containing protein [Clostridium botulinum]|nr:DUF3883 domain-containing protein [Clostridium botulinum]